MESVVEKVAKVMENGYGLEPSDSYRAHRIGNRIIIRIDLQIN